MNSIVSINAKAVQQILSANNLGTGMLLEEEGKLRVFLDSEPTAVLAMDAAASQLETATGRLVDIGLKSSLSPAQQTQLERVGTAV